MTISIKKRRSTVSSNDLRLETLAPLIRSTIDTIPYMGEDEFLQSSGPKDTGTAPLNLEFLDSDFEKITSEEKIKFSFDLEQLTFKHR